MKERDIQETSYGLHHQSFRLNDKVLRFGEKGDTFYIIVRGQCTVWLPLPSGVNKVLAALLYGATSQNEDVGFTTTAQDLPKIDLPEAELMAGAQAHICSKLKQRYGSDDSLNGQLLKTISIMSKAHRLVKMNQTATQKAAMLFSRKIKQENVKH